MLSNERFALDCRAWYEEQGLVVDASNGEFAHCPLPERYGDTGYYLLWEHHQHQGLLQSKDINECCFFVGHARKWLEELDRFPDNYFELWDIYEEFAGWLASKSNHKIHSKKDERGRSVSAVKGSEAMHRVKTPEGKSSNAVKGSEAMHRVKTPEGKSYNAVKGAYETNKQAWKSEIDGYLGSPGSVALHNKRRGWDPAARVRIS
jgi:hypothetical protein